MLNQGFYTIEKRVVRAKGPFTTGPLVIGLAHFVVALINIRLTTWSVGMATVWAANALVLAALLVVPTRRWTPYVVSAAIRPSRRPRSQRSTSPRPPLPRFSRGA